MSKFQPATLRLSEPEIKQAIDDYVSKSGWHVAKVTLASHPHQYNGPDTFEAVVEVELQPFLTAVCRDCRKPIALVGSCWEHTGDPKPRHPAVPVELGRRA